MDITLPGHSAPAVGFEVPLEMLAACHLRVQDQCSTLLRLVTHIAAHGPDRPAQEAATAVMRYFDTSARHHHDDEERDLFPALIESMAGSVAVGKSTTSRILRALLSQVAAGQAVPLKQADVSSFTQLYERHIAREETELLPMARRLLSDAELDRVGLAMRMRRTGSRVPANPSAGSPDHSQRSANGSTL